MREPRPGPRDDPAFSRRDFLTQRLPGRIAELLGGGAVAVPAAAAVPSDPAGSFSSRDLTRMGRDEVRAALARIRARAKEAR